MKRSAYIVFCLVSALLFVSCNPEGTGIFMSISTERKIKDSDFLDRTVNRMLVSGTTYYACAGKIFYRNENSPASWSTLPIPSGYLMANDMALLGGNLYAVFLSDSSSGLFTWDGTSWSQVPVSGVTGMATDLFMEYSTLFVLEQRDGTYEDEKTYRLYSSTNGSAFTSVSLGGSEDIAYPVRDVAHDGTNFWLISGPALYSGTTAASLKVVGTAPSASGKDFVGLFWDGTSKLYLAREGVESGAVFTSSDGSTWATLSSSLYLNPDVSDFAAYNNGTADIILLGRGADEDGDDGGYYESVSGGGFGTPSSSYSAGSDYSDLTLSENPVRRLYAFGNDIFACPAGDGLWLRNRTSGNWDRD